MKSRIFLNILGVGLVFGLCMAAQSVYAQIDMGQIIDDVNEAAAPDKNQPPAAPQDSDMTQSGNNSAEDSLTAVDIPGDKIMNSPTPVLSEVEAKVQTIGKAALLPQGINSVVFTYWEYTALLDAKKSRQSSGVQRGVTEDELNRAMQDNTPDVEKPVPPPEEREISLGGIVFTNGEDWTIWLNGQRVTPDALPEEIIDLKVTKHYIDVKWLDDYTQKLYPIRLRAHQRFNLDARIFLPG